MKKKENNLEIKPKRTLNLDPWQREVLAYKGNIIVCSGRQTGKSTIIAIKAAEFVLNNPNKQVLIISVTEDQARELLQKVLFYVEDNYHGTIKTNRQFTNKEKMTLKNGSIVRTKAVGQGGAGARGFTIDMLIADEAAFMPEDVWPAVTPMLLTTGGDIILISTPKGRGNYFHKCYEDPTFKAWYVNTIENLEKREVCGTWTQFQRDKAFEHIKSEQYRLSDNEFKQEYRGEFVQDLLDFFPDAECKKSLIQQRVDYTRHEAIEFVIGVDIGRMGGDKTVFVILERRGELLIQREKIVWNEAYLDRIAQYIIELDKTYNFVRIYLDNGGIGIGVFDILYNTQGFKKRVKGINNAEKIVEYNPDGTEKRSKWMKEEIYTNLLFLMMKGKILLFDDSDIWLSLKATQFEYINQRGGAMMKINHTDHKLSHIVEAIVRAAMIGKEKINNFRISYI